MALQPILTQEQLDGLDPILRAEYRQGEDGRFVLDVTRSDGFELTNTRGLLNSLSAARGERDGFERELREMRSRFDDVDIDALRAAEARLAELTANGQGNSLDADALRSEIEGQLRGDFERRTATLTESHHGELATRDERIERLTGQLRQRVFGDAAREAILAIDKDAEPLFLLPEIERRTRVVENEDGSMRVDVLNSEGQVDYISRDGQAVPKTLGDVVEDLRRDARFGRAFGGVASGSGASGKSSGGAPQPDEPNPFDRTKPAEFSLGEQMRLKREDPEKAARLQAAAPKSVRQPMIPKGAPAGAQAPPAS